MAGRIQDSDVKDATEAGAASRLINDTKIYVTGSGNKTLIKQSLMEISVVVDLVV